MFPRLPRVLRAQITGPLPRPAPLVRMPSSHVAISDVRSCVPGAPFVAVLRVLASPSATPKCLSGTSTLGTAAATRSQDFQVRNSFPECNTPLISAHGALSSTPCCRLIEGFGRVCAVTSIVDCSVRSIESIDGRYGGCWRRSSPKPPSHKPRRRLNSSSTPGPVDCARAVWRKRYPGCLSVPLPPKSPAPPPPPGNPLQTAPSLFARYDDARAKPTHARALRRRRRSLARSIARAVCGGSDGVRLHRPSRPLRASRVTRAHAHGIAAHRARRHRFPFPLHARMRALRAATALARSLARVRCGVGVGGGGGVQLHRASRASRARACTSSPRIARVITAPLPRTSPIRARGSGGGAVSFARLLARAEAEAVGLGEAVGYFARHAYQTRHVRRSSRARTRISSPLRARHHRFPSPPRTTGTRALLRRRRSLARRARAVWRWRWRWRSVTSRVMRARHARHARARARHRRASRASSPPPLPDVTHARARQRRRRCLVCSLARARGGGGGGVGGGGRLHRASRVTNTSRASLVTRAHAHIITASRASSPFSVPPAHDRHARAAAAAVLARSRACGVALAMEVAFSYIAHHARHARHARAHVRHHRASRASSPPPFPDVTHARARQRWRRCLVCHHASTNVS